MAPKPVEFIPIAEETGLIQGIGDWVLTESCRTAATWPVSIGVAVNVSPLQFKKNGFVERVKTALTETGLAARRLEIEITETVLIDNADAAIIILGALKALPRASCSVAPSRARRR